MGRSLTFTNGNDSFRQGFSASNVEITLTMLDGNDSVLLDRDDDFGGGNVVIAGAGQDSVVNHAEAGNLIRLGDGNDSYVGLGFGSFATDRADTVLGGAGSDMIAVQTFQSLYLGEGGNDRFFSVGWQNRFDGGAGRDLISFAPRDDDFTQGGSGVTVDLAQGLAQTGANRFEELISIEDVIGTRVGDVIAGSGAANRITGGLGFDEMAGRGGADTFVYRGRAEAPVNAQAIDLIDDFTRAQGDKVDLSAIDANTGLAGNQAFRFIGGGAFSGQAAELRFAGQILSGDINGDGRADFRIGLADVASMLASDFLL